MSKHEICAITPVVNPEKFEIPDHVVLALMAVVEWSRASEPDDEALFLKDIPVIAAWLEEQGLLSPSAT